MAAKDTSFWNEEQQKIVFPTYTPVHGSNEDRPLSDKAFDANGNRRLGNMIKSLPEDGVDDKGRNKRTGKFMKGNTSGKGRIKGSRNKLTQAFLDRVASRTEQGLSPEDVLLDMVQDPNCEMELRFKAAAKILDLTVPKAASVEVTVDEEKLTKEQIDARLRELINGPTQVDEDDLG